MWGVWPGDRGVRQRRPLLKHRRHRRSVVARERAEVWAATARGLPCAVCGRTGGSRGHHTLYQGWLRAVAAEHQLDFELLRWDPRNLLALCEGCHVAHHSAARRVPRRVLPAGVFQMAQELGLVWRIDRTYPEGEGV